MNGKHFDSKQLFVGFSQSKTDRKQFLTSKQQEQRYSEKAEQKAN